jgi:hypothetical protein
MYKHAIAQPGLVRGGTGRVNLNSPASKRAAEKAIALGVSNKFSTSVFQKNRMIFERYRFHVAPIAEALNRVGVRMHNDKKWTAREVSWLLQRLGPIVNRDRRVLRSSAR